MNQMKYLTMKKSKYFDAPVHRGIFKTWRLKTEVIDQELKDKMYNDRQIKGLCANWGCDAMHNESGYCDECLARLQLKHGEDNGNN